MDLKGNCNIPIGLQKKYSKDKAVENEVHLDSGKHESSCFATPKRVGCYRGICNTHIPHGSGAKISQS